jgi:hypothetical protein
MIDMKF